MITYTNLLNRKKELDEALVAAVKNVNVVSGRLQECIEMVAYVEREESRQSFDRAGFDQLNTEIDKAVHAADELNNI